MSDNTCVSFAQALADNIDTITRGQDDWDALEHPARRTLVQKLGLLARVAQANCAAGDDFAAMVSDLTFKAPKIGTRLMLNILELMEDAEWTYDSALGQQAYEAWEHASGIWGNVDAACVENRKWMCLPG